MKKLTPRAMVRQRVGGRLVTPQRVLRALELYRAEGWVVPYLPRIMEADVAMPLVRVDSLFGPWVEQTYDASWVQPPERVTISLDELFKRTVMGMLTPHLTRSMATHGLLIADAHSQAIHVIGAPPPLATLVNHARHQPFARGMDDRILVASALNLPDRPQRLRKVTRRQALAVLHAHDLDAEALLDASTSRTPVRSRWLLRERLDAPT